MNHKTKVNTSPGNEQANVVNTTLAFSTVRSHLSDAESQAIAAKSLGELCFEQLDRIGDVISDDVGLSAVLCLDALLKAVLRNVELIQDAVDLAGSALLEGGAA